MNVSKTHFRGYQNKLRPIRLNKIPDEEKAAAAVVAGVDLNNEVDWLLGLILSLGSKVVFSHNDINTGNILVRYHGHIHNYIIV